MRLLLFKIRQLLTVQYLLSEMDVTHLDEDLTSEFIFDLLKSTDKVEKKHSAYKSTFTSDEYLFKKNFQYLFYCAMFKYCFSGL
jgi:hypothetical protein